MTNIQTNQESRNSRLARAAKILKKSKPQHISEVFVEWILQFPDAKFINSFQSNLTQNLS
jgi:hypothetical protein